MSLWKLNNEKKPCITIGTRRLKYKTSFSSRTTYTVTLEEYFNGDVVHVSGFTTTTGVCWSNLNGKSIDKYFRFLEKIQKAYSNVKEHEQDPFMNEVLEKYDAFLSLGGADCPLRFNSQLRSERLKIVAFGCQKPTRGLNEFVQGAKNNI